MFDSGAFSTSSFSTSSFLFKTRRIALGGADNFREEFERSLLIKQDQQDFLDVVYIVGHIVDKLKSM